MILASEHQKMVHNSFLLHGYYNYRHIILGKFKTGDEDRYYLGVPGVYDDWEKMAAEMFGFEAFEGKQTPAGTRKLRLLYEKCPYMKTSGIPFLYTQKLRKKTVSPKAVSVHTTQRNIVDIRLQKHDEFFQLFL